MKAILLGFVGGSCVLGLGCSGPTTLVEAGSPGSFAVLAGTTRAALTAEAEFVTDGAVRGVRVITVGSNAGGGPDSRPAILVVAGVYGPHSTGTDVALKLADSIAVKHGDLLERVTFYIVPCVDTQTSPRFSRVEDARLINPTNEFPADDDHDGRVDEDGPKDVNGDGRITMMRVANPAPGSMVSAEYVIDKDDPRIMRRPDKEKGERATHALLIEGVDQDGDGKIAEDAPGGIAASRNFPYRWPEYEPGAGRFPLEHDAARSLVDWMLAHDNIVAVVTYGPNDTLFNVPQAGRNDDAGMPLGIENGDKSAHESVTKLFKEVTKHTGLSDDVSKGYANGSFEGWAYAHFGVYSFSTPVWVRPDLVKQEKPAEEGEKKEGAPGGGGGGAGAGASAGEAEKVTLGGFTFELNEAGIRSAMERSQTLDPQQRAAIFQEMRSLPPETMQRLMQAGAAAGLQGPPAGFPGAGGGGGGRGPRGGAGGGGGAGAMGGEPAAAPAQPEAPAGGARGGRGGGPPGGGGAPAARGGRGGDEQGGSDDAKWLKYSDDSRGGSGFVAWQKATHPQLGEVEVGGFTPGFKLNAPEDAIQGLVEQQAEFLSKLAEKLPSVRIEGPSVKDLGGGVWRVDLRIVNDGEFPTRSTMGVRTRRIRPTTIRIDLPEERVMSGSRLIRVNSIEGYGKYETDWTVTGRAGETVPVKISSPELGEIVVNVVLKAQQERN